jgi:hypothetical protein
VVDIPLPGGMKMADTLDADEIHHGCELDEDIRLGVFQELKNLEMSRRNDYSPLQRR